MEDILSKIVKEAQISKLSNLTAACYATQGISHDFTCLIAF